MKKERMNAKYRAMRIHFFICLSGDLTSADIFPSYNVNQRVYVCVCDGDIFHFIDSSLRIISFYFIDTKLSGREREKEKEEHNKKKKIECIVKLFETKKRRKNKMKNTEQINIYNIHSRTHTHISLGSFNTIYLFCFVASFHLFC